MAIEHLTFNLAAGVRYDEMEGRQYLVAPVAMMAEGVINGSRGPLFYPEKELAKTPVVWNHKPIVVYHPEINGQGVSACDPTILTVQKVGIMMNTRFEGKLRTEAWLEKERLRKVDPRTLEALESGKVMEVSTGVFTDNVEVPGEWNGKKYTAIATNLRPDHLALLPDKIGAYSVADGGGLLQANNDPNKGKVSMDKKKIIDGLVANANTKWEESDRTFLEGMDDKQLAKLEPVSTTTTNTNTTTTTAAPAANTATTPAPVLTANTGTTPTPVVKPLTAEEYIANAPAGIREVLVSQQAAHQAQKDEQIKVISANKANVFTAEYLKARTLEELKGLAALAVNTSQASAAVANYSGAVGQAPIDNSNEEEPLVMPIMNFKQAG